MANISFYGSHNAAVVVENNGEIVVVIEIERFLNSKNAGYSQYIPCRTRRELMTNIIKWIEKKYGISEYDNCIALNTDTIEGNETVFYDRLIPSKNFVGALHHESHAASGFYQSDYNEALIVSFDGGGNDGFFNIYHAENRKQITEIDRLVIDLGFAYMSFGDYLGDIKMEPALNYGNLVYSGKIMGLCSYGKVREEWYNPIKDYYLSKPSGENYLDLLVELSEKTGIVFSKQNRLKSDDEYDLAKTSQVVFEDIFIETIKPYLNQFPDIPLILVGGCALNILLNTRLKEELDRDVFIPPNPNDCGIASGLMLNFLKPDKAIDLTYSGIPVLDYDTLFSILEEKYNYESENINTVAKKLHEGNIIGVVRGTSEHGPRALGNRSIICDPTKPNMKDTLNEKVKHREWYRPFAPVVRLEDVSKYFEMEGESRWMSFCPKVKEEWRETLVSITHVDGTARVQTVTREQNEWLYDLITEFEKISGVGVLLNTSFNVNGKPILSTFNDALKVYDTTNIDGLVLEDYMLFKQW
jgi:carbamoyltransferase